jgi:putative solute:sodium symporter small subunit
MDTTARHRRYWRRNLTLTTTLLVVWGVLTFGGVYAARDLQFVFFGWPFSFWMAAQGLLLLYCLLIWFYALCMERLDASHPDA